MIVVEIHGSVGTLAELDALMQVATELDFDDNAAIGRSSREGWLCIQQSVKA